MWPELAHQLGLVPLLSVGLLHWGRRPLNAAWWWVALVFGVSWAADTASHWVSPSVVSLVYPLTQAALVGAVFLDRQSARRWVVILMLLGSAAVLAGANGPEWVFRSIAWGGVVAVTLIAPLGTPVRAALLTTFGLGGLAWICYVIEPSWGTWGLYQACRVIGTGCFVWGAIRC